MGNSSVFSILILVLLFAAMYFLMIRPQKKREKETNAMRSSVQVGDEIITIGGFCAKVVKTKEESIVIQIGPDKVKLEVMRWAVSKVVKQGPGHAAESKDTEDAAEAQETKKAMPKRMKKATAENENAEVEAPEEPADDAVAEEKAEEIAEAAENQVEEESKESTEDKEQ